MRFGFSYRERFGDDGASLREHVVDAITVHGGKNDFLYLVIEVDAILEITGVLVGQNRLIEVVHKRCQGQEVQLDILALYQQVRGLLEEGFARGGTWCLL